MFENRYPGIRCDIPPVVYQYPWNPKVWNEYYVSGAEILNYFQNTVKEFALESLFRLRHRVNKAEWQEDIGKWRVLVTNLDEGAQFQDECYVFVNAMGFLNNWRMPEINGLQSFTGVVAHSVNYPLDLDPTKKRVDLVALVVVVIQN